MSRRGILAALKLFLIAFVAFLEVLEVFRDPGSTVMLASILAAVQ